MVVQQTRWFEYGEPIADGRMEAQIRTTYQTGPNETAREDDIEYGTIGYEGLDLLEEDNDIREHIHDDGSVLLSGLSVEAEERLLESFERVSRVEEYVRRGCTPVEAVDYWATEDIGYSQRLWGEVRDVGQDTISRNVAGARERIEQ